ncbi:cytochrome c oxidase subunit, partial [Pseudomonas aeruginosa BWHPSA013]
GARHLDQEQTVTAMDIGTLRGLGTLLIMVAFIGLVIWAYSGKRKKSFDEATMLPFADDPEAKKHVEQASRSNKE